MAFFAALAGAAFFTPVSIWLAEKFGVLDQPDPRKVHAVPMPRWGGLGLFGGTMFSLAAVYLLLPRFRVLLDYRHPIFVVPCRNPSFANRINEDAESWLIHNSANIPGQVC